MSFHDLQAIVPAMLRAADRVFGCSILWPEMDLPDSATTLPAAMFQPFDLLGCDCRLVSNISTLGGDVYPSGAIFRCIAADPQGRLTVFGSGVRIEQIPPQALEVILK